MSSGYMFDRLYIFERVLIISQWGFVVIGDFVQPENVEEHCTAKKGTEEEA